MEKTYRIGDICESVSDTYRRGSSSVVLVNTSDVLNGVCLNHTRVENKDLKGQFKKSFKKDDILYSEIRPANKRFAYIDFDPTDYIASTKLMVIRSSDKVRPRYLFHFLKRQEMLDELQALAESRSGTFPQITFSELALFEIKLPSLETQDRIVAVIDSFENKIALNNRINHNLEEQAQALYKSWFLDFEPFKDGIFIDSELGMIPEGWHVKNLLEIANLFDSKRKPLSGNERSKMDKVYPYYGATSIMDYVDDYIFDGTYLLMGEDGSVMTEDGFPFLQYVTGKFWPNNHAHVMQGCSGFSTEMLHCALLRKVIKSSVTGAVQAKISQANMKKILFACPPRNILAAFDTILQKTYSQMRNISSQNATLSLVRDNLLPHLMSSKLGF